MAERRAPARRRRLLAAGLYLLAPFVGEYVLGNQPITSLPYMLPVFALMYGAGALIVREVARRAGAGWPMIIALAAAYALVEEGLVDQMLTDPDYLGVEHFGAVIPGLGISAQLTAASLAIHTVWSICVPIAIMEAFDREDPAPWLGRLGLGVVSAVFVLGCAALGYIQYEDSEFLSSPLQLVVFGAAIVALVVAASTVLRRWSPPVRTGVAARPRIIAATAFGLSTLYWILEMVLPAVAGAWAAVGSWAVLALVAAVVLARSSARPGWDRAHRLGVAVGVLATYLWQAPIHSLLRGVPPGIALVGSVVIGATAVVILALAVRTERRRRRDLDDGEAAVDVPPV